MKYLMMWVGLLSFFPSELRAAEIMLYNGPGVDTSNWQNLEKLFITRGYSYQLVNSEQINKMTLDDLANFRLLVFPGGYGGTIYQNINANVRLSIRKAVRERGLGYLGFCAGAWVAVGKEAGTERTAKYGFAVAYGSQLSLYRVRPTNVAVVDILFADQSHRNLVVWGAPYTPEWNNGVIARYSNGGAAISQVWAGRGFVVITGPHPEAPEDWRDEAGYDADGLDYEVTYKLIDAALTKTPLAVF